MSQYTPYNPAITEDRIAWVLCQIIDDDAPMGWTRYRFAAECIAHNPELMSDLAKIGKPQVTTDNAETLVNAQVEIERLTALCQEYRENGDRLMRVADEYKAEIERLTAERDAALADAKRYQWMKREVKRIPLGWLQVDWDLPIDKAMKGEQS